MTDLAAQANQAEAVKVSTPLLEAYWAKHDPTGERRARLRQDPISRTENSRAIAARMDAEYRARQPKAEAPA